jgi:DNA-binding transcriptional ArsR family regulator
MGLSGCSVSQQTKKEEKNGLLTAEESTGSLLITLEYVRYKLKPTLVYKMFVGVR